MFAHQSDPVSPGAGTIAATSTSSSTGTRAQTSGAVKPPSETGNDYWVNTDHGRAFREPTGQDGGTDAVFYHDVAPELVAEAKRRERHEAETAGLEPWPLEAWPNVPTRFLLCRDDRMFPAEWTRRIVRERLGIVPDEIDGGHYISISRPKELADRLESYRAELS